MLPQCCHIVLPSAFTDIFELRIRALATPVLLNVCANSFCFSIAFLFFFELRVCVAQMMVGGTERKATSNSASVHVK